jgi:hypothetical protein
MTILAARDVEMDDDGRCGGSKMQVGSVQCVRPVSKTISVKRFDLHDGLVNEPQISSTLVAFNDSFSSNPYRILICESCAAATT